MQSVDLIERVQKGSIVVQQFLWPRVILICWQITSGSGASGTEIYTRSRKHACIYHMYVSLYGVSMYTMYLPIQWQSFLSFLHSNTESKYHTALRSECERTIEGFERFKQKIREQIPEMELMKRNRDVFQFPFPFT